MAAGLGFKTFTTGEVLTAADTNGYLMQGVLVFASAAARNAAITSPQEGQFAYTKDTNGLWYYDGAAWVASGATGDIEGVTAGTGISGGGTSGTVTITNDMATTITASGDIVVGTGSGTYDNLPIGTTGQILTADTTVSPYKVKWAAPAVGTLTLSQIATGSTTSGSTLSLSSLSSYDTIKVIFTGIRPTAADSLRTRINGNTGSNYHNTWVAQKGSTTSGNGGVDDGIYNTDGSVTWGSSGTANQLQITLTNCKATGFTTTQTMIKYVDSSSAATTVHNQTIYLVAEAVSSLTIGWITTTFVAGTYTVWAG